jgi:hypothetical protein
MQYTSSICEMQMNMEPEDVSEPIHPSPTEPGYPSAYMVQNAPTRVHVGEARPPVDRVREFNTVLSSGARSCCCNLATLASTPVSTRAQAYREAQFPRVHTAARLAVVDALSIASVEVFPPCLNSWLGALVFAYWRFKVRSSRLYTFTGVYDW